MIEQKGGTKDFFTRKIEKIFSDCHEFGLNTVFVQIRPFSDSFYPSAIFPWSKYLTGEQGKKVDYNPLEIMVETSKKYGLSLHVWVNPFRISLNPDPDKLSEDHPALKYLDSDVVYVSDKGIYFNPASLESQKLILSGIQEIAKGYNVDGIHIDDYFYPDTDKKIDENQYSQYIKNGGKLDLTSWRIEVINSFVSGMYRTIKSINPDIIFSISPSGNIKNNYDALFADVSLWSSEYGYCDIIIPQIYFGSEHKKQPFEKVLKQWEDMNNNSDVKLLCGIGAYKAVEPESAEWENPEIIRNQVKKVLSTEKYDGYCLFSYSSLVKLSSDKISNK